MLEKINEQIEVLAKFTQEKVSPLQFKWRSKIYRIEKLNLMHMEKKGADKIYFFSVSDEANSFRLSFSTRDLSWRIEELYYG
jgi:hypothetical protein